MADTKISQLTATTTPNDTDVMPIVDTATKKITWSNIKATLKTYFDTLYALTGHNHDATYAPIAEGVTNGDSHDHSGGDGAQINHTTLSNIGTNTHVQIDSHIAATNPHSGSAPTADPSFTGTLTAVRVKLTEGASAGKVLTSDADGDATWETPTGSTPVYGMIYRTSSTTIALNAWGNLLLDTDGQKVGITHSTVSNTDRITVSSSGDYLITYGIQYARPSAHHNVTRLLVNNTTEIPGSYSQVSPVSTDVNETILVTKTTIATLSANDYITIQMGSDVASQTVNLFPMTPSPTTLTYASITINKLS